MRFVLATIISTSISFYCHAQDVAGSIIAFEKKIEQAVVDANVTFLKSAYADDFRFKHGTGTVDSKASWIENVQKSKGKFVSRKTDSVEVELHNDIAITQGKLTVHRTNSWYVIYYLRAYRKNADGFELFMHRTFRQVDH